MSLIIVMLSMPMARNAAGLLLRWLVAMIWSTASRRRLLLKWPVSSS
jgi:hypothetical protein